MAALTYDAVHTTPGLSSQEREHMILKFAPLVRYVVGRLAIVVPRVFDVDDLLSYGTIGLIEAVDRFDPTRGISFEAFASDRIRGSVIDALRAADWVPRSSRKRAKDIQKTMVVLEETLGRAPTDEEVAQELDLSMAQYHKAMADAVCTVISLQRAVRTGEDDSAATLLDIVPDDATLSPGQHLEENELHRAIVAGLQRLDDREKKVLALYYEHSLTLREISEVLEISESRVWQLHARAIMRIRAYVEADAQDGKKVA